MTLKNGSQTPYLQLCSLKRPPYLKNGNTMRRRAIAFYIIISIWLHAGSLVFGDSGESLSKVIPLSNFDDLNHRWRTENKTLVHNGFRVPLRGTIAVPSPGYWILKIFIKALGEVSPEETIDAQFTVNGQHLSPQTLKIDHRRAAQLRITTPYLLKGNSEFELLFDNELMRRSFSIERFELLCPAGDDHDFDGIPDLLAKELRSKNHLTSNHSESRVSPAHLEGTMRFSAKLNNTPVFSGSDPGTWYAELPLDAKGDTTFQINYEHGIFDRGSISWTPTNISDGGTHILRKGDSLKFVCTENSNLASNPSSITTPADINWAISPEASATQSTSEYSFPASKAIDGKIELNNEKLNQSRTKRNPTTSCWLEIDLGADRSLSEIIAYYNSSDPLDPSDYVIKILNSTRDVISSRSPILQWDTATNIDSWKLSTSIQGRFVRFERIPNDDNALSFFEIEILGSRTHQLTPSFHFITHTFSRPGNYTVSATNEEGVHRSTTVHVIDYPDELPAIDLLSGSENTISLPWFYRNSLIKLDPGNFVKAVIEAPKKSKTPLHAVFTSKGYGKRRLLGRVGERGAIISSQEINIIHVTDPSKSIYSSPVENLYFPGKAIRTTPVVIRGDITSNEMISLVLNKPAIEFTNRSRKYSLPRAAFTDGFHEIDFLFPLNSDLQLPYSEIYNVIVCDRYGNTLGRL